MEKLSITFLGTGNAIPTKDRNHSSILLNYKNEQILIDCGEGTQRQFRYLNLSPTKLTRILITHWHGDHILGLPGLFQTLAMSNYSKVLRIYGPIGTKKYISLISDLLNRVKINLEVHEITSGMVLETNEFRIDSTPMAHQTQTLAYSFNIKDKLRLDKVKLKKLHLPNSPLLKKLQEGEDIIINGKKIKAKFLTYLEKGKKITFIFDTKLNENAIKIATNSDLLICESTFSSNEEAKAKEYMHLTASHAAEIAKKSKSAALVLTHISQRYEYNSQIIEKEAKKTFRNVKIAKDLDSIVL